MQFIIITTLEGREVWININDLVAIAETATRNELEVIITPGKSYLIRGEAENIYNSIQNSFDNTSYLRV